MRDAGLAVMLFAAGFGTRMGTLTRDRPKPLIEVGGRALIDHALDLVEEVRPPRVVANLHYLPEQLTRHLAPRGIDTVLEAPSLLDTGGGLRNALPRLGPGPVMTVNTDAVWRGPNPLKMLLEAWDPGIMDALLIGIPPDRAYGHVGADFDIASDGKLSRGTALIYGGAQIIKTDRLRGVPQEAFSLNIIWDAMLENNSLYGLRYPGRWCDVGHPGGIADAEAMMEGSDV